MGGIMGGHEQHDQANASEDEHDRQAVDRRRMLRMGGLAAAAGAAAVLANGKSAGAVDGDPLILGTANIAGPGVTQVFGVGFEVYKQSGIGAAIFASAPSATALEARSNTGVAIMAKTDGSALALRAEQRGSDRAAAFRTYNTSNTKGALEVQHDGPGASIAAVKQPGVSGPALAVNGLATFLSSGVGTSMQTTGATNMNPALRVISGGRGSAVFASTTANANSPAVQSTSGSASPAVRATGKTVPVSAAVPIQGNAAALTVQGVATFTRSGVITLGAPATNLATVAVAGGLTATSHVLATVQTNSGTIAVRAAVPNTATGKIDIYLTGNAPAGTKVAWFVFG